MALALRRLRSDAHNILLAERVDHNRREDVFEPADNVPLDNLSDDVCDEGLLGHLQEVSQPSIQRNNCEICNEALQDPGKFASRTGQNFTKQ